MCCVRFQVILLLTVNVILCQCKCPQITFKNVTSVKVCNARCMDQSVQGCIEPESFKEDVERLDIYTKTKVFRRGAIQNMMNLRNISLITLDIKKLNPGCFLNLPSISRINLTFNRMQEILWDVFTNSTMESLDFSWNEIESIEDEAFSNMPNLKTLNLTRNQLNTFSKNWFKNSPSLETLILSYNQLKSIWYRSFDTFPNLKHVDLSFNKINYLGADLFNSKAHLNKFDLTSNRFIYIEPDLFRNGGHVDHLVISLNKLSFLPNVLLNTGHIRTLRLHPNPWQCPCLDGILWWIHQNNATIESFSKDDRLVFNSDYPQCYVPSAGPKNCRPSIDQELADNVKDFFQLVNYSDVIREKPTSQRPNFDTLPSGLG